MNSDRTDVLIPRPVRICFVSLQAYPLFNASTDHLFGGSEVRAWLLGRGLARRGGWEVSFVTLDHGQPKREDFGGVKVFRHSFYQGPPHRRRSLGGLLRRVLDRLDREVGLGPVKRMKTRVYEEVGAEVYGAFGTSWITVEVARYASEKNRRFVFFLGHDLDLSLSFEDNERILGLILDRADLIVAQTESQARRLELEFARRAVVIANPVDLSRSEIEPDMTAGPEKKVLWVGKSNRLKQPLVLIELARRCRDVDFVMVLNYSDPEIHAVVLAARPDNVAVIERLSFAEMENLFGQALALVNTSSAEGFPNTFLQAGKHGVPILSLHVDPDGFIQRHGCGLFGRGDFHRLARGLKKMIGDPEVRSRWARNVRDYVRQNHDLDQKAAALSRALKQTLGVKASSKKEGGEQCAA